MNPIVPPEVKAVEMSDVRELGVVGAVVGATLGAPFVGRTAFRRLRGYEPIPARMAPCAFLDAWVMGWAHADGGGRPAGLARVFRDQWTCYRNESAFGKLNLERGLVGSLAGSWANPLAQGANALGRAVGWGLRASDATSACEWAEADAEWDHAGVGVSAAIAAALLVHLAQPGRPAHDLVMAVTAVFSATDPARIALSTARAQFEGGATPEAARDRILSLHEGRDILDAGVNLGWAAYAVLAGESKGFGEGVLLAVGMGGQADGTGILAGAVSARLAGEVSTEWTSPLAPEYVASSVLTIAPPNHWRDLIDRLPTLAPIIQEDSAEAHPQEASLASVIAEDVVADETAPDVEAPLATAIAEDTLATDAAPAVEAPKSPPTSLAVVQEWIRGRATDRVGSIRMQGDDVDVEFNYLRPPVARPDRGVEALVTFRSAGNENIVVDPRLEGGEGVSVAARLASFQLPPATSHGFPVVLQAPAHGGTASLTVGGESLSLPVLPTEPWFRCGPFDNRVGDGMIQAFKAEDVLDLDQVFNGRSNIPLRWEQVGLAGFAHDVEPWFGDLPGVVYLACRPRFDGTERLRLVVATSPGGVVTLDRKIVLKYLDTHTPIPRAIEPYVAEFQSSGEHLLIIKLVRAKHAFAPLTVYFTDLAGRIRMPDGYGSLAGV